MKALQGRFNHFDSDKSGFIEFNEFSDLFNSIRENQQVKEIFDRYKNPKTEKMTFLELQDFMNHEQGENMSH